MKRELSGGSLGMLGEMLMENIKRGIIVSRGFTFDLLPERGGWCSARLLYE